MSAEMPFVDWKEELKHLPVQDIIKDAKGAKGIYEKMIIRKNTSMLKSGSGLSQVYREGLFSL